MSEILASTTAAKDMLFTSEGTFQPSRPCPVLFASASPCVLDLLRTKRCGLKRRSSEMKENRSVVTDQGVGNEPKD